MNQLRTLLAGVLLCAGLSFSASTIAASPQDLTIKVFNPGAKSLFPVSSTLVLGPSEAVLIDAQFQRDDAQAVLNMIRDSGRKLTTVYVSHGDPDFYFGLDVILAAYPNAEVVASSTTVAHIEKTVARKVAYWGPILKHNAPRKTIVPKVLADDTLHVDGQPLQIVGLDGHDPKHTFVWIPAIKTVTGGVPVYEGVHVWMADAQTPEARNNWRRTLDSILALSPDRIVPGHVIGRSPENAQAVAFTRAYIAAFEEEAAKAKNAAQLIDAMKARYPDFKNLGDLELSAKVIKGEKKWP